MPVMPFTMLGVLVLTLTLLLRVLGAVAHSENFTVVQLLHVIQWQRRFECLLLVQHRTLPLAEQFFGRNEIAEREIISTLEVSVLQMTDGSKFQLRKNVNRNLMVVMQLTGLWSDDLYTVEELASALTDRRQTRIVTLLNARTSEFDEEFLPKFFLFCWQKKFLHVIVLLMDYQETNIFYSYTPFPKLAIETRSIFVFSLKSPPVFPSQLSDMKGFNVSILLSGADPRVITYVKPNGELFIGGSTGNLLLAFAHKHHCNLVEALPLRVHGRKSSKEAMELLRKGTIEISAGVTFPEYPFRGSTYPYENLNACLLIPVEADLPPYEFYLVVFSWGAFALTIGMLFYISIAMNLALHLHGYRVHLLELLVHNNCLRGLLSQSFISLPNPPVVVRIIYMQIFVFGIMLTTFYNSYFSTYLTHPPKQPRINTLTDLLHSGMKAYIYKVEADELLAMAPSYRAYTSIFRLESDFEKYLRTRDSLDPRFVYVVPTVKRTVINEQQKTFSHILFRQPEEICVYRNIPFGFPLQYNSVFAEPLNLVIRQVMEAGLSEYWRQLAFYELIAIDQMHISDLGQKKIFIAMQLDDLRYIWFGMVLMALVSILVFIGELCIYHRWFELFYKRIRHFVTNFF